MRERFNYIRHHFPLWSEIYSILISVYGRATTLIAFFSPFLYLFFLPDTFLISIKVMTGGALLVVASNLLFIVLVPSVQRNYPKYVDYEDKCLKLEKSKALDLYEEFGQVSGQKIQYKDWSRSGLSFQYLHDQTEIPEIDEYKENFLRGSNKNSEKINRMAVTRSLSAIKYVTYDSSKVYARALVSTLLTLGIVLIYLPAFLRILKQLS